MYLNEIGVANIRDEDKLKKKSEELIKSGYTVLVELKENGLYSVRYFILNDGLVIN